MVCVADNDQLLACDQFWYRTFPKSRGLYIMCYTKVKNEFPKGIDDGIRLNGMLPFL